MSFIENFQQRFNYKRYIRIRQKVQTKKVGIIKYIYLIYLRRIENSMNSSTGLGLGTEKSPCCKIGDNLKLPHRLNNVIIARNCSIGKNVTLFHNVAIAEEDKSKITKIGDNVTIGAGAVILNNSNIGNNSIVGANSVVTKNVADNTIVAGNPAKVIKKM